MSGPIGGNYNNSSFTYSSNSNRTSQTVSSVTTSATYDGQDRILTFGTKTFAHNANGERTSVVDSGFTPAQTTSYTFDAIGNLKTVTLPSTTVVTYILDAHGRRMKKTNASTVKAYYVYDNQDRLQAVLAANGTIAMRFVYGVNEHVPDYLVKGTTKYMLVKNHLGSPVQVINTSNGTVSQEIKYDEWGNITADTSPGFQPFGFAGCLYDIDTKLCHFHARDYDASVGRWLTKDPDLFRSGGFDPNRHLKQLQNPRSYGYASTRKMETNLYGYTFGDPVNFIDSTGRYGALPIFVGTCVAGYVLVKINKVNRESRQSSCKQRAETTEDSYRCEKIGGFLEDPFYKAPEENNE